MSKIAGAIALAVAACLLMGCLQKTPVVPPRGFIFTSYKAPLSTNFDSTPVAGKVGKASTMYFREPFLSTAYAWKDASTAAAAANGEISKVNYADYEYFQVLGIVGWFTVVAHGN